MLDSIPGYVSGLDYTALGKVANRTYANGLVSLLDYYSTDFRLKSIHTGSLQGLNYTYDGVGNVLSMYDYVNGSLWGYGYDLLNRLISVSENGVVNQSFQYSSLGNLVLVNNGSAYTNYSYGVSAGPHAVTSYSSASYYFNPGNITASCSGVSPSLGSDWNITANTTCSNGLIRLSENKSVFVAASKSLSMENLVLEPAGMQSAGFILVDNGSVFEVGANTTVYGDDLSSANLTNTISLVYDANGNMVNDSRLTFVYNDDNRMKRVYNGSQLVEEYQYDHGGNRKVKITVISPSLNKTTYYLSEAWIREEYTNGTAADTLYVYANNELLARKDASGTKHYYHPDHLGSTTVITKQDGNLDERISYEPWGTPRQKSKELYQFTSQEWEPDLGFYDYNARQYSPFLRRFMQPDYVIEDVYDPQMLNRYTYVRNNPILYTDPSGNFIDTFLDAAFIVYDVYTIAQNPTDRTNYDALGVDVVCAVVPGLTGGGMAVRAVRSADKAAEIVRGGERTVEAVRTGEKVVETARTIKTVNTLEHGFESGREGEKFLEKSLCASKDNSQRTLKIGDNKRVVDVLIGGVAHESKVGYTALTQRIKSQVVKDSLLTIRTDIKGSVWHFYKSAKTGKIGPSKPLARFLRQHHIKIKIHNTG
jgi:RHS repeat-associated protein